MTKILNLDQIKQVVKNIDVIREMEKGFILYSQGKVVVPPVGEMLFEDPPGDCHIKYGFIRNNDYYVIKIASGFYNNPNLGLPASNGLMLLFSQKTGEVIAILLDEGCLTDIRTAAAGAVVAKYMAPKKVKSIGIIGPGIQGRLQLQYLLDVTSCRDVMVCGRDMKRLEMYKREMEAFGFKITPTLNVSEVMNKCNLIITCTPSKIPLIKADQVKKGTHITAMGSDTAEKQELDSAILKKADKVIVDSIEQAQSRGECYHALERGLIKKKNLIELGHMLMNEKYQRKTEDEITVADLTGVAIQDIQISKAIYEGFLASLERL